MIRGSHETLRPRSFEDTCDRSTVNRSRGVADFVLDSRCETMETKTERARGHRRSAKRIQRGNGQKRRKAFSWESRGHSESGHLPMAAVAAFIVDGRVSSPSVNDLLPTDVTIIAIQISTNRIRMFLASTESMHKIEIMSHDAIFHSNVYIFSSFFARSPTTEVEALCFLFQGEFLRSPSAHRGLGRGVKGANCLA